MKLQLQFSTIAAAAVLSLSSAVAWAHFGIVIPEHSAVLEQKDANVHFTIAFAQHIEEQKKLVFHKLYYLGVADCSEYAVFLPEQSC